MQFEDFINRVQEQAGLPREEAMTVTRAVLETLGERVDRQIWNGVVAQLPQELEEYVLARADITDRYELEEFYNRVGARSGLKRSDAAERTRQVMSVLKEAISAGEWNNIVDSLRGREYGELFGEKPSEQRGNP
ncbi:MAG TPA: DUF2267 domain-containing protein [Anaerolineales bacterium]|nr:DUF2267 domain-containing protein [Anaerolineales bacterium]